MAGGTGSVSLSVALAAPADEVWERAVTMEGVNDELRPLVRMTVPRHLQGMTIAEVEPGVRLGRSWLLLGGLIPVDWDDLTVAELGPSRFLERSSMASMSIWQHERTVAPGSSREGACVLTDSLSFELRRPLRWIPGSGRLAAAIVWRLFRHRHARLVAAHGAPAGA